MSCGMHLQPCMNKDTCTPHPSATSGNPGSFPKERGSSYTNAQALPQGSIPMRGVFFFCLSKYTYDAEKYFSLHIILCHVMRELEVR